MQVGLLQLMVLQQAGYSQSATFNSCNCACQQQLNCSPLPSSAAYASLS